MKKEKIINICNENLYHFNKIIEKMKYETHGILNSEMLIVDSLINYFDINLIIESGRGRGQSTKILAESFKNPRYKIISIEYNKYSPDVKISYERLKKYQNLKLIFGNSFEIIPGLITENCCVLIDGPKGFSSIKLAVELLKNSFVKSIFIHDLHKNSPYRLFAEKVFTHFFFTDDKEYINEFKHLDKKPWFYTKGQKKIKRFPNSLSVIFNNKNSFNKKYYQELLNKEYEFKEISLFKYVIKGSINKFKKIFKFPFYYIYYEKVIRKKKELNLLDFIKNWINIISLKFLNKERKYPSTLQQRL